ncbi:armadillo-type protein, partial [Blyttiomyces helicus]
LAALTLKRYVDTHWSSKTNAFVGPEPPEEIKIVVRGAVLAGLVDPLSIIRVATASTISKIAAVDWPESWPDLFETLMGNIRSGSPEAVHGGMRVLTELVRDCLSDQHFPLVAPGLIPELHRIFCSENVYTPRVRARSLIIFREFADAIFMMNDEQNGAITYLEPLIPLWTTEFQKVLAKPEIMPDEVPLCRQILTTIVKLVRNFPKQMSPYLVTFLEPIWIHLVKIQPRYTAEIIESEPDENDEVDSDGEIHGIESLLFSLFEYVKIVARKSALRHMFTTVADGDPKRKIPADFLNKLVALLLNFMQISVGLENVWIQDMNQFIEDDENEAMNFNVRIAVEELLMSLVDAFPTETLHALCTGSQGHFEAANKARSNGSKSWWRLHEACLMALGRLSDDIMDAIRSQKLQFDLGGLFSHIVVEDMKRDEYPFLQGRAMWFSSRYASALPPELVPQYLGLAVSALSTATAAPAVRVLAVKAIRGFCETVSNEEIAPFQAQIMEGTLRLAEGASESALVLLLETLVLVIKINDEVTARYENILGPLLLNVWVTGAEDVVVTDMVTDLFSALAANTFMAQAFHERMIPAIKDAMRMENISKMPSVVATAIDLMHSLVKNAPEHLLPVYVTQMFPDLVRLLLTVEDHGILQNGQDAIKVLVQRDLAGIARWTDGSKTGLDYVIQFIAKLLHPSQDESASIFVGDLITQLIKHGGDNLVAVLPDLLTAVTRKLEMAKTSLFIQTLVMVFAHLIQTRMETVIDFLSGLTIENKNGLAILLNAWCENFADFQGFYSIKVSSIALCKLVLSGDARLQAITVRGDLIVSTNTSLLSPPSEKKDPDQYTAIPFPAKAIKLLIDELQHKVDDQLGKPFRRGNVSDDEDEDGADGSADSDDVSG